MLEAAVPPHQQCPRTQPSQLPEGYAPPFPAYCARFGESAKELVMTIIGARAHHGTLEHDVLDDVVKTLTSQQKGGVSPSHWLMAKFADKSGADNRVVIAYWPCKAAYEEWGAQSGFEKWWASAEREDEGHGWYREVLLPSMDRFETVFSDNSEAEGFAHMREKMSGPIQEHVYWGSSRDRMPAAQTDALEGEKLDNGNAAESSSNNKRVKIQGKSNLCIIRSGQDWSNTLPNERKLYLETMHPVLETGMNFLRDEGREIGCYDCRFMSVVDTDTLEADKDRTFGLAYFQDLLSLEKWSKEHKTHLDIFHRFLQYAQELENNVSLRLFHEILVLKPEQQQYEYINCQGDSGVFML